MQHLHYRDEARLAYLAQLPHLRQLNVDSAETLLPLQPLRQLTSLHVYTSLYHLDFGPLTRLSRLEALSLERCRPLVRRCISGGGSQQLR